MTAFFTDFADRNARTGRPSPTPLALSLDRAVCRGYLSRVGASQAPGL